MSKIDDIKNLKRLLDEKVIDQQEFDKLKNEILGTSKTEDKTSEKDATKEHNSVNPDSPTKGMLTVSYAGRWFLIDAKTKITINGVYHSTHSTKKGFSVDIPIQSESMTVKATLGSVKTRVFELNE